MNYIAEEMITKSRFINLFKGEIAETQDKVIKKVSDFIEESDFTDKNNYSHLCNIFTAMAFCFTYEENGLLRDESINKAKNAMYEFLKPRRKKMKDLSKNSFFIPFMKLAMPHIYKKSLGKGWNVVFPKCGHNDFKVTTYECIYCTIFKKYEIPELIPIFCYVDDFLYDNMPGAKFRYTQQMGNGGAFCDYVFSKRI